MTFISETRRYYPTLWDPRYDFRGNKKLKSQVWETMAPPGGRSTPVMSELIILSRSELRLTLASWAPINQLLPLVLYQPSTSQLNWANKYFTMTSSSKQSNWKYEQTKICRSGDQVFLLKVLWPVLSCKVKFNKDNEKKLECYMFLFC